MQQDADFGKLVTEIFQETNSLENVAGVRSKLLREKSLVDTQLQAGIEAQMALLTGGIDLLKGAQGSVYSTENSLAEMDTLYTGSTEHVTGFADTQSIATILANFELTRTLVSHFETFQENIKLATALINADGEFDIDKPMRNLVPAHYVLNQLMKVREDAVSYLRAKDSTSDTRLTLKKLYEPLDRLMERFDATLLMISEDLLEVLRIGNRSLVVRLAKIIEMEERQDVVAKLSEKRLQNQTSGAGVRRSNTTISTLSRSNTLGPREFGSTRGGANASGRTSRRLLERCFESIERSIKAQFDNCMHEYPPDTQPKLLLENLTFVNSELIGAKQDLEPCCPARWQIFNKFVLWYHKGVHRVLETIMSFEPPAEVILELLRYVKEYYATMSTAFSISRKTNPELLNPPLLDGRERDLYDDYLKILVSKLKQWYAAIWTREKHDFENDVFNPEYHSDGIGLETHTMVTKLVSQQLEVAANSGQARVIAGCVDACCEMLQTRQQEWVELLRSVTKRAVSGDPDAPHGLYEYLFVIANDQDRSYAFLDEMSSRWSERMPPRYQGRVVSRFSETQEGYQDVTKECFLSSLKIIYSDTKPAFDEIFRTDKWYAGVTIQAIIDTYADFVTDAKKLLLEDLFEIFLGKLCTETILWYLRMMTVASRSKKLNLPRGRDRILEDAKSLFSFFTNSENGLDPDVTRKVFYIFDVFSEALAAPLSEIPALFSELRSRERDAPIDMFEAMLSLRNDVDPNAMKNVMTEIRAVAVHANSGSTDAEDTGHSFLYEYNHH